ncbi:MAG: hypothetical protein ACOY3P_15290 [Planctomycetota bacterium]
MAVTSVSTAIEAAQAAISAGDYEAAERHVMLAELALAATPDTKHGDRELRWPEISRRLTDLRKAIREARMRTAFAGGIQQSLITHGPIETAADDYC